METFYVLRRQPGCLQASLERHSFRNFLRVAALSWVLVYKFEMATASPYDLKSFL